MTFDVSSFVELGAWIFQLSSELYQSLVFDFGDFQINGLSLLIGIAVFCIICYAVERIVS